ncbi:hypothetical protein BJX62DRAFT_216130 [Aspergillus germanicus]
MKALVQSAEHQRLRVTLPARLWGPPRKMILYSALASQGSQGYPAERLKRHENIMPTSFLFSLFSLSPFHTVSTLTHLYRNLGKNQLDRPQTRGSKATLVEATPPNQSNHI